MVDISEIAEISLLLPQLHDTSRALSALSAGGAISSFVITTPPSGSVTVNATDMTPPPQMITAIQTLMQDRHDEIMSKLTALGVTGVEASPRSKGSEK